MSTLGSVPPPLSAYIVSDLRQGDKNKLCYQIKLLFLFESFSIFIYLL